MHPDTSKKPLVLSLAPVCHRWRSRLAEIGAMISRRLLVIVPVIVLALVTPALLARAGDPPPPPLSAVTEKLAPRPVSNLADRRLPASTTQYGWDLLALVEERKFGVYTDRALRLDSQGRPHIAYGSRQLFYAHWDGAAWQLETVDPALDTGDRDMR